MWLFDLPEKEPRELRDVMNYVDKLLQLFKWKPDSPMHQERLRKLKTEVRTLYRLMNTETK